MTTTGITEVTAVPGDHDLTITRTFAAPRELVFRAWTDPRLVERWLGPKSMTMDVRTWELHHGGRWRFVNHDADGTEYAFRGVFHGDPTVEDGVRWTFEFEPMPGAISLEHITFTEVDGHTTVHTPSVFPSVENRDGMIASGMQDGVNEGYDKLDALLAEQTASA